MNILVLNAGSASLKFEVIAAALNEDVLEDYEQLISGAVENIDKEAATFLLLENKHVIQQEKTRASDYRTATQWLLNWLDKGGCNSVPRLNNLDAVGHRVVHGADRLPSNFLII